MTTGKYLSDHRQNRCELVDEPKKNLDKRKKLFDQN